MKRKCIWAGIFVFLLAAAGMGIWYAEQGRGEQEPREKPPVAEMPGGEMVTATGTISAGITEMGLDLDFLETDLVVEEVYVSASDEIRDGMKLLKITDSSLREAKRELERARMDASLAYRQGIIDCETDRLEAENTWKKSQIASAFAQTVYEDTIAKAELEVEKAEQAVTEAQELVEEYTAALEEDAYYIEYEIEEKKAAYEKHMSLFFEKLDAYGYELKDDEDDDPNTFDIVKQDGEGKLGGDSDGEATVLQLLKNEYQENKEEYDQALKDYEAATEKARAGMDAARDALLLCQLALQEKQIDLEEAKVDAQAACDLCVIQGEKAQDVYETERKGLEETLEALADEKEEAEEQYALFLETIGDGYLYAENQGSVLMIQAVKHRTLSTDGVLMACSNADQVQVTVSVSQADIAGIAVGDTAAIVTEDGPACTGVVTALNPVSLSDSRSAVSYQVLVEPEQGSDLPLNHMAYVYFGITGQEYDRLLEGWEAGTGGAET